MDWLLYHTDLRYERFNIELWFLASNTRLPFGKKNEIRTMIGEKYEPKKCE